MPAKTIVYFWRSLKFKVIVSYIFYATWFIRVRFRKLPLSLMFKLEGFGKYKEKTMFLYEIKDVFIHRGCLNVKIMNNYKAITNLFKDLIAMIWLCEKMKTNINFSYSENIKDVVSCFKNCINAEDYQRDYPESCMLGTVTITKFIRHVGGHLIPCEFCHKALLKIPIKSDFKASIDTWIDGHLEGEWVAVHYRGTDVVYRKDRDCDFRYKIKLDSYIAYLKEVLDEQCSIFACSDQAQFIDKMHTAFPSRVHALDIQRSYNNRELHRNRDVQQKREALMDILVLTRAKLIYTTGSNFVDIVRYFNPETRIISMDQRKLRGGHYLPIPKKNVFDKLAIKE